MVGWTELSPCGHSGTEAPRGAAVWNVGVSQQKGATLASSMLVVQACRLHVKLLTSDHSPLTKGVTTTWPASGRKRVQPGHRSGGKALEHRPA